MSGQAQVAQSAYDRLVTRLSPARRIALATTVVVLATAPAGGPPAAGAAATCSTPPITNFLAADATRPGVIDLYFFGAKRARVFFFECVDGALRQLGTGRSIGNDATLLRDATTWRCDRLTRRFVASTTLPDGARATGSYSVRTGSCARRFDIGVTRRAARGATVRIRVVDRWGIGGIHPRLCIGAPQVRRVCRTLAFAPGVAVATERLRPSTTGRWRIELRVRRYRVRAAVAVGGGSAAPPPTLVATGDSTMQGVDSFLADELGDRVRVRSNIRPGTGISKASGWLRYARSQVSRFRQRTTVISIGAAEGFPLRTPTGATPSCCGEQWVGEYSRRVRSMMRTYLRGGRARVLWLTLPLPRGPARLPITNAVNAAILRAAAGLDGVRVLRMDQLFSPNGFQEIIRYRGRNIPVRTPDGIHLNVPGTAIAAKVIFDALRERRSRAAQTSARLSRYRDRKRWMPSAMPRAARSRYAPLRIRPASRAFRMLPVSMKMAGTFASRSPPRSLRRSIPWRPM